MNILKGYRGLWPQSKVGTPLRGVRGRLGEPPLPLPLLAAPLRHYIKGSLLFAALVVGAGAARAAERPNILFIMSDDHASHAISAYGGRLADVAPTPHLDRLAGQGMRFTHTFVTNSICTPSRASILTGKYSHLNGVYSFTALDQSQPTLPKLLQAHGYQTGIAGKWHLLTTPRGFDWWSVMRGQGGSYHATQFVEMPDAHPSGLIKKAKFTVYDGHAEDIVTDKALTWFKETRDPSRPFFFMLHYKAPHDPWEHAHRYDDYLADVEIPMPDNFFDHGSGRSPAMDRSLQFVGNSSPAHTHYPEETGHLAGRERRKAQYQEYMKHYLRCVKGIDDNLARVFDYLDRSGLSKNTIVIYTSDQGFFLGEHGLYDKRFMYEEALRTPLIVRWPGVVRPGTVNDELVLNIDFPATMLAAAGHEVPTDFQGRSLVPLLEGRRVDDWREAFYYRYYFSHFNTPPHYGVRTRTHKLIHFNTSDEWELYDLARDPAEMNNLARDPSSQRLLRRLRGQLQELQKEVQDDPADLGENPRTGLPSNG